MSPTSQPATAIVNLDVHHHAGPIDRRIFGGFLEHLGRAVYGGAYDPGNTRSDERGFRRDVLEALRPLAMPIVRYPGGNFVSCYNWKDGVGPREARPRRLDYAWKSIETNQFGTDEFMEWCKALNTAPMMAVNLGTAGTSEAAQLLEYCNLPTGTAWADLRAKHGHNDPYNVKLWCLGNEMDGPWQAGHIPADVYAQRARAASAMMKGLDSTIQTVACGSSGRGMSTYLEWDRTVIEQCWDKIDFISAHRYSSNERNDSPAFLAEGVEIDRIITDYRSLIGYVRGLKRSERSIHLSFDEWNVWYRARGENGDWKTAPALLEEVYNLEDALVCAQYLASFVRNADVVKVACIAQIVNVIAPILTRPDGLLVQSIYHPFAMFSQHAHGVSLTPAITSPTYAAGHRGEQLALDAAASFDESTSNVTVYLINRDQSRELPVTVKLAEHRFSSVALASALAAGDVKAANTWEKPDQVKPAPAQATISADGSLEVRVPAPGLVVVKVSVATR